MRDKLTLKQELFCQYYVAYDGNGTKAAIKAGYSENTADRIASENLTKLEITQRIEELLEEAIKAARVTANSVISDLKTVRDMAIDGEKPNLIAAVAALEKLGKYHKLFVDKTENETTIKMDGNFTFIGDGEDVQDQVPDTNGEESKAVQ